MYTSFSISNFRLFRELKIDNLARVNLITGKNNTGKTSLLEAIMLHAGDYNFPLLLRVQSYQQSPRVLALESRVRGVPDWKTLFKEFDTNRKVTLNGVYEVRSVIGQLPLSPDLLGEGEWKVEIEVVEDQTELATNPAILRSLRHLNRDLSFSIQDIKVLAVKNDRTVNPIYVIQYNGRIYNDIGREVYQLFPSVMLSSRQNIPHYEDAKRFSELKRARKEEILLNALQVIEQRLENIDLFYDGTPIIYGDIGLPEPIPLSAMGDGMNRIISLILAISSASNGVVLVDEIENGLHYSIHKDVWRAIAEASRDFNTQIFATTHSLECARAAHEAFAESGSYDFRLHRLERTKTGNIQAVTYDQESMEGAIDLDLELR